MYANDISFELSVQDKFKSGYWFTLTLFEIIVVQYVYEHFAAWMGLGARSVAYAIGLAVLSVLMYVIAMLVSSTNRFEALSGLLSLPQLRYYMFFAVGRMIRLHIADISDWKWKDYAMAVLVAGFVCMAVINWWSPLDFTGIAFHCNLVVFELSALLLVFATIYRNREYWSSDGIVPKSINFIGRRTLDIYLIHYFFLPTDLHVFGTYFMEHPAPVAEAVLAFAMTLAIVGVSLICSSMLRCSRQVAKLVLGKK